MIHALSLKQIIIRGVSWGLLAFAINFIARMFFPDLLVAPGHLVVFLSALTLGVTGAFYTLAISIIPESIILADGLLAVRLSILTFSLAALCKYRGKLPICIVGAVVWMLIFALCTLAISTNLTSLQWIKLALGEIFLLSICNLILLHPNLALKMSSRSIPISQTQLLVQACCAAILATGTIIFWLLLVKPIWLGLELSTHNITYLSIYTIVALLIALSLAAACLINFLVSNGDDSCEGMPRQNLLRAGASEDFTGLHSDYWRRRNSTIETEQQDLDGFAEHNTKSALIDRHASSQHGNPCRLLVDQEGNIEKITESFADILQIRSSQLNGKNLNEFKDDCPLIKELLKCLKSIAPNKRSMREIRISDNTSSRFFEVIIDKAAAKTFDSKDDLLQINLNEITKKRTLSPAIVKQQKLETLGSVCANVLHSVLENLEVISALTKKKTDDEYYAKIESLASSAQTTARKFADFATSNPQGIMTTDLTTIVSEQIELIRIMLGKDCIINFTPSQKALPVACDPALLKQVLTNLTLNARNSYLGQPGEISVILDTEVISEGLTQLIPEARVGSFARIKVKDHGCGMTPELIKKVFDPQRANKGDADGTASLILSSVYAIVRANDGFLSTESAVNKGTHVVVYLPLASDNIVS